MPIEREPKSPLPRDFKPPGGIAYRVQDGDSWGTVAAALGIRDAWTLIQFNFGSRSPAEISWSLKPVGLRSSSDPPGTGDPP